MLVRQLEYLIALATEQHFAHAAERCGVSQPTLSAALRQLEEELGIAIVERGNRFRGFTPQGEIVLRWARQMLADKRALEQELHASRGMLAGRLRLGVIPSANAVIPRLTVSFARRYPLVGIDETETTSIEILRDVPALDLDAGITYVDNEPVKHVRVLPIYSERYMLIVPPSSPLAQRETATWAEAAAQPLCLMRSDMQNRRIYDATFASVGVTPNVVVETHSMMAKLCYLHFGLSSIMPTSFRRWVEAMEGMRTVPLIEPEVSKAVGLVIGEREPVPAIVAAFWEHVAGTIRSIPIDL